MRPGRFASLLGAGTFPRASWDEVLLDVGSCVVASSLGSIVPNWLLVVPRERVLNFARWQAATGAAPERLVSEVVSRCGWNPSRVIWFEHGPGQSGSDLGCGVEQAHLHILFDPPFSFDGFVSAATAGARLDWRWSPPSEAHRSIHAGASYLLLASDDRSTVAQGVEQVGSQYLRRVIAGLVGRPDAWDYRHHPHVDNIERTVAALRRTSTPPGA